MTVTVTRSKAKGKVSAPPSKSMAHRLLICSHLAGGGTVSGLEYSEDIKATLACLDALDNGCDLNCNESGSTLRFMIPLCLLKGRKITLRGTSRLFSRSLSVYEDICRKQDIYFEKGDGFVTVNGVLSPGHYSVRGDISSQFISGLMFVLPLLSGDSEIEITHNLESKPYLDLTFKALADFGISERMEGNTIYIKGGQRYRPRDMAVEGDYSNAAFFDALNLLGGDVEVTGLDKSSLQGDRVYKDYFGQLEKGTPTLDISDCPDLGPILMALAAAKNGCTLTGTHRLKIKESDRGAAMKAELEKFGITVSLYEDKITVSGTLSGTLSQTLCGHNDHRIVMALAVLCTLTGGSITDAQAVNKSLPDFFERLAELGIEVIKDEA